MRVVCLMRRAGKWAVPGQPEPSALGMNGARVAGAEMVLWCSALVQGFVVQCNIVCCTTLRSYTAVWCGVR